MDWVDKEQHGYVDEDVAHYDGMNAWIHDLNMGDYHCYDEQDAECLDENSPYIWKSHC